LKTTTGGGKTAKLLKMACGESSCTPLLFSGLTVRRREIEISAQTRAGDDKVL